MILEAALLWTIYHNSTETVLQYTTKQDCQDAIEIGLPYGNVPPKEQLFCIQRPDHNPTEGCLDGSVADLRGPPSNLHPHHCRKCISEKGVNFVVTTSSLCEAHGYKPATPEDSDSYGRK
jgi:hypothetical protein